MTKKIVQNPQKLNINRQKWVKILENYQKSKKNEKKEKLI